MRIESRTAPLATVMFLGEQQDITDPEAAVGVAGQAAKHRCSGHQQRVELCLWIAIGQVAPTRLFTNGNG